MSVKSTTRISVVVPNWNGKSDLPKCLDSLLRQTQQCRIILVENGSIDGSVEFMREYYPQVTMIVHRKNLGFAGGVNAGIRRSIADGDDYVALFNNDAIADTTWLEYLVKQLNQDQQLGIATCKLMTIDHEHLDSTGDLYTSWGLPYPRGRQESDLSKYDRNCDIFGASGGATLYRIAMFKDIGLFDEDFFAYYEDVDISFRAQLMGWKICFVPQSEAYHQISATGGRIPGFTTYQTIKNLPWVLHKNVPFSIYLRVLPRFLIGYGAIIFSALARGQYWVVVTAVFKMIAMLPKKSVQRYSIQRNRKVTNRYIWNMMIHELPPNAAKLRRIFYKKRTV